MSSTLNMRWVFAGLLIGIAALSFDLGKDSAPQLLINQPPVYSQLKQ
jgi:hypothetical protein